MSWQTAQLQARLQAEADFYETIVQLVEANSELFIYLNRPPHTPADCRELLPIIESILKQELPDTKTVSVFSRELGHEEPDWHTVLHLHTPDNGLLVEPEIDLNIDFSIEDLEPSTDSVVTHPEPQEQMVAVSEAVPLSSFCFSRNRQLVENEIDRPSQEVSEVITQFHGWEKEQQIKLLEFLKEWFSSRDTSPSGLNKLSSEAQEIVAKMQADKELQRSLKIWFSRYCYDPQKTITEISGDNTPHQTSHTTSATAEVTENRNTTSGRTYSSYNKTLPSGQSSRVSSVAGVTPINETSTKFDTAEIIQIAITALIASGLTFLVSDVTLSFGSIAIFLFAVSIVSGFLAVFKNFLVSGIATALEIVCIFAVGFTAIFISIIGNLVGVALAISVYMVSYKDRSLLTAKSLRIMIASAIAVILGLFGSNFIKVAPVIPDASSFQASGTVVLQMTSRNSEPLPEQTFNIKGAIANVTEYLGVGTLHLEIALSSEPISNEQVKLLLEDGSAIYEDNLCEKFAKTAESTTKPNLIFCFEAYIDRRSKIPVFYRLVALDTQVRAGVVMRSENSVGVSVSNIEPRRNGQVDLSLNTVIEDEQKAGTAKVDVKVNTKVLKTARRNS